MNFISISDFDKQDIMAVIRAGLRIKKNPEKYSSSLKQKTLLMLFEAPSLRTRLSFEAGMTQLGGHAIAYHLDESTIGKKESPKDFARVVSRYADTIMARIYSHGMLEEIACNSAVPAINGMTNREHPCQVLSDIMTIYEKKNKLNGLKLAYLGDGFNNTTHSLLLGCALVGMDISIACPKKFFPDRGVAAQAISLSKASRNRIEIIENAGKAAEDADVIYTDSWMSYHIPKNQENRRKKIFSRYQVNSRIMRLAKKNALFMHCLPAKRGDEVTDDVMDSRNSIVYDQAENRLHCQKALLLKLIAP